MANDTKVYNPQTAAWELPGKDDAFRVKEHEAQIADKPAPSEGEYAGSPLFTSAKNEPRPGGADAVSGPAVTANETGSVADAGGPGVGARGTERKD